MARRTTHYQYGQESTETSTPDAPSEEFTKGREVGAIEQKLKRLGIEGDPTGAAAGLNARLDELQPERVKAREEAAAAAVAEREKAMGREKEHEEAKSKASSEKENQEASASSEASTSA